MNFNNPNAETLVVGLGFVLVVWYLAASIFNRRRGIAIFHWLRNGMDRLGGQVAARWIGSSGSGAQIQVRNAKPPFRDLEIVYLLASRELLPLFLLDLLRGKRDRLIIKGRLGTSKFGEVEVVPASSSLGHAMRSEKDRPWTIEDGPDGLLIGTRGPGTGAQRTALTPLLNKYGPRVEHISWSKNAPHLIVILSLAGLYVKGEGATELYDDVATAAASATRD